MKAAQWAGASDYHVVWPVESIVFGQPLRATIQPARYVLGIDQDPETPTP